MFYLNTASLCIYSRLSVWRSGDECNLVQERSGKLQTTKCRPDNDKASTGSTRDLDQSRSLDLWIFNTSELGPALAWLNADYHFEELPKISPYHTTHLKKLPECYQYIERQFGISSIIAENTNTSLLWRKDRDCDIIVLSKGACRWNNAASTLKLPRSLWLIWHWQYSRYHSCGHYSQVCQFETCG